MPEQRIVEGYATTTDPTKAGTGADSWLDGLRSELRRETIRQMALERIRNAGRGQRQRPEPSRAARWVETLVIGVGVTLVSAWVCSKLGPGSEGRR